MNNSSIVPGSTICILGAGQLGKMSLTAAHQLGYHTMVWSPQGDIPAMEMATHRIVAPFNDRGALEEVIKRADVVTTEWENIPVELLKNLESRDKLVRPSSHVLKIAQSRWMEKSFVSSFGIATTPTIFIKKGDVVTRFADIIDEFMPGILKTDRLGYDGKGQCPVNTIKEVQTALDAYGCDCVLEKCADLICEISVIVARNQTGIHVSPAVVNRHKDGILASSLWSPELIQLDIEELAQNWAAKTAKKVELQGILAVEFFVTSEGLLFNEMAPRPHNSFHASIEASYTSQFEQHVRSVCGLPLGDMRFHTPFEMRNLLGSVSEENLMECLMESQPRLHLYGKKEARPGRKMGHITHLLSR